MYNVVKIGETEVPMLSMASCDLYYKNVFGEDPYKLQAGNMDPVDVSLFYMKMGYIMAEFARLKDRKMMLQLNMESYEKWLDEFGRPELIEALPDVYYTYNGSRIGESKEKKEEGGPSEE